MNTAYWLYTSNTKAVSRWWQNKSNRIAEI